MSTYEIYRSDFRIRLNSRTMLWGLITILVLQLYWYNFVFEHDSVSYHYKVSVSADEEVCAVGDSIALNVVISARDSAGVLRLYDNLQNIQIDMCQVENGGLAKDFKSLRVNSYKNMPKSNRLGWEKYKFATGQSMTLRIKGITYRGENNMVVYDFGPHGKCTSPYYDELGVTAQIYEVFPSQWWTVLGNRSAAAVSNHVYLKILP